MFSFILNVLNNNGSLEEINTTFIVLIHEIKEAKIVEEFRPISLCNLLYKIVAKVIANKKKTFSAPNNLSKPKCFCS